ncbi:MAG: hypothetical protein JW940_22855, partial [Polyangiaceae bacterium]|nr:hypothetical protein [Polyangiaceae bacterium]
NFTSVRNSVVRNNIIAFPARHGISFWQETDNPRLGSSHNVIAHNLMVTSVDNRQALGFTNNSTDNRFENNVVVAVSIDGGTAGPNDGGQLLVTDATTVAANTFVHNAWISGFFGSDDDDEPYSPNQTELRETDFDPAWFADFPTSLGTTRRRSSPARRHRGSTSATSRAKFRPIGRAPSERSRRTSAPTAPPPGIIGPRRRRSAIRSRCRGTARARATVTRAWYTRSRSTPCSIRLAFRGLRLASRASRPAFPLSRVASLLTRFRDERVELSRIQ